tara:strand:- start:31 stop:879 length:849 start_codon:yes stop_codon:yes gene_type:complete
MSFNLEPINTGVTANDGQGDPLRTAFSKTFSNSRTLSGQMLSISGYLDNRITEQFSSGSLNNTGQYLEDEISDLSGSLNSTIDDTGQYILDVAVTGEGISGMHRKTITFDIPASGESVIITGSKTGKYYFNNGPDASILPIFDNNDALYQGKYSLSLTERHQYHHYYSISAVEDWQASGAFPARMDVKIPGGDDQDSMVYTFQFPVTNIGNPYEGGSHEYTVMLSGDRADLAGYAQSFVDTPMWVITRTSEHTYAPFTGHGANNLGGNHYRRHYLIVNLVEY